MERMVLMERMERIVSISSGAQEQCSTLTKTWLVVVAAVARAVTAVTAARCAYTMATSYVEAQYVRAVVLVVTGALVGAATCCTTAY